MDRLDRSVERLRPEEERLLRGDEVALHAEYGERTLTPGETVTLKPGHRFGKKVKFKRGRVEAELDLLRVAYPRLEYVEAGRWVRIPDYPGPNQTWNREKTD